MTPEASDPCQAVFARASEPRAPWGSSPWHCTPPGALPARATIPAIRPGSKGHPGRGREFGRNGLGGISQLVQGPEVSWILADKLGWVSGLSYPSLRDNRFSAHQRCLSFFLSVCAELCTVLLMAWGLTAVGTHPRSAENSSACLSSAICFFIQCRGLLACILQVDLGW